MSSHNATPPRKASSDHMHSLLRFREYLWTRLHFLARLELHIRFKILRRSLWDLRIMSSLPSSNGIAVDVGANIGVYSYAMSRRFESVIAYEPNPALEGRLRAGVPKDVRVRAVALGSNNTDATLRVPVIEGRPISGLGSLLPADGHEVVDWPVKVVTLDSELMRSELAVDLIKIDVEGLELEVLLGAEETLAKWNPIILVEAEERHRPGAAASVTSFLRQRGMRGVFVVDGAVHPVEVFDPHVHQRLGPDSKPIHPYANMFIFSRDPAIGDLVRESLDNGSSR